MVKRIRLFRRLWGISPKFALAFLFRKARRHAGRLIPRDEWNKNWLGEEMRPFNSLR
jgi:hypothetical protein